MDCRESEETLEIGWPGHFAAQPIGAFSDAIHLVTRERQLVPVKSTLYKELFLLFVRNAEVIPKGENLAYK